MFKYNLKIVQILYVELIKDIVKVSLVAVLNFNPLIEVFRNQKLK